MNYLCFVLQFATTQPLTIVANREKFMTLYAPLLKFHFEIHIGATVPPAVSQIVRVYLDEGPHPSTYSSST